MFKSKKIKYIERVIKSCETTTQLLNIFRWLNNLYESNKISIGQYNNLSILSFEQNSFIQDYENYIRRLNSV